MKVGVAGCGRWGSLIAWYLDRNGHAVTLYGRASSAGMQRFIKERKNDLLTLPESIELSTDVSFALDCEVVVIAIASQSLRAFLSQLADLNLRDKTVVLCMKGIEVETTKRLSEIVEEILDPSCKVAVWLGPGHVQEFYSGIPNCMVIDSKDEDVKTLLVDEFSSELIRFYYGTDIIGNEIGAAAKNVIGIAAGILDGGNMPSLKGPLMARGAREVARLIHAMGGNELSAYGLCHLGDYETTLFSPHSNNRRYGEAIAKGEDFTKLAEGVYTSKAMKLLGEKYGVDLPITNAVYRVVYEGKNPFTELFGLFDRKTVTEFLL